MDEAVLRMGKRDAARNNSGEPVDHSGPGLGVGPTSPPTVGRKPAACPPIGFGGGSGVGSGVGVDLGVDVGGNISQHKSGQGSGDGVPGGANGESAVLRSNATQPGSFLDELQNNRNIGIPKTFQNLGRSQYCGIWTVAGWTADGSRRTLHRVNCKTWGCPYCGPRKARRYRYLIGQIAEREQLTKFLTLTLDPSLIEGDSVRYIRRVFDKFRLYLRRKFGIPVKYIAVLEFHKSGIAHLHLLVDRFIDGNGSGRAGAR
jgi:hypothetical protein